MAEFAAQIGLFGLLSAYCSSNSLKMPPLSMVDAENPPKMSDWVDECVSSVLTLLL